MYEYTQIVKIILEDKVSKAEMRQHIREAVQSWGGQYHPDSFLFSPIKTTTPGKCKLKEVKCQQ